MQLVYYENVDERYNDIISSEITKLLIFCSQSTKK